MLRKAGTVIRADRMGTVTTDQVRASGNVRINHQGNVFEGLAGTEKRSMPLKASSIPRATASCNDGQEARLNAPTFWTNRTRSSHNATYTTRRRPGPAWVPDWILRTSRLGWRTTRM